MIALVHDVLITAGIYALVGPRGHARDGHRDPHDPRVLAVRHRRDLRQDQGEHRVERARHPRSGYDGRGRPVAEPDADALGQHLAGRAAADPVAAAVRRRHAEGLRVRDVRRRGDRRLLLDLHRRAGARDVEDAREAVPADGSPSRRARPAGAGHGAATAASARGRGAHVRCRGPGRHRARRSVVAPTAEEQEAPARQAQSGGETAWTSSRSRP